MRILVCGGRKFEDWLFFKKKMTEIVEPLSEYGEAFTDVVIIQGEATGADFMAKMWAQEHDCEWKDTKYPADWNTYGHRAGPIRNKQMLDEGKPDLVVAFPGDRGTPNMIKQSKDAGIKVVEVKYE